MIDEMKDFEKAVKLVFDWLEKKGHPYGKVIITAENAEFITTELGILNNLDKITAIWLSKKHPTMTIVECEKLRIFCKERTIINKECYGDGAIMLHKFKQYIELYK